METTVSQTRDSLQTENFSCEANFLDAFQFEFIGNLGELSICLALDLTARLTLFGYLTAK